MTKQRPTVGQLIVPYMVDERSQPIDFKRVHDGHVAKCASQRRCGICGKQIRGYLAFVGPNDGRRCFSDPWMHPACAELAMQQCPFLGDRRGWRDGAAEGLQAELEARYEHNMHAFTAPDGRAHLQVDSTLRAWHFEALGELQPLRYGRHGFSRA